MSMLVDAHAHIFPCVQGETGSGPTRGLGYGRITQGEQQIQLLPPYNPVTAFTPEMLLANLDWAGVDAAVLLQGPFYGACNDYVAEALQRHPDRLVGAAYYDPWALAAQPIQLAALLASAPFRAVKLECSVATGLCGLHPTAQLDQPDIAWLWQALADRGLVLVLDLGAIGSRSYQTAAVEAIARAHPALRMVIAHLGQPRPPLAEHSDGYRLWSSQIGLGRLANVWFDSAALPAYCAAEGPPFPTAAHYLRTAIEQIGADKILWGTDQPGLLSVASLPQLVAIARSHTQFLSPREQALVLGENARAVYGF